MEKMLPRMTNVLLLSAISMGVPTAAAFMSFGPMVPGRSRHGTGQRSGGPVCLGAEPWDLTGDNMFSSRNASKMTAATETLRRSFTDQMRDSAAMPGFLRGALDPLRLKRNVQEARTAVLSRLFDGADAGSVEDATARGTASIAPSVRNSPLPMSDGATATPAPADVPASLDHVLMQAQADFVAATASGLT